MFHHFHGGRHAASQGSISADELTAMIESIGTERILCAREFLQRAERGTLRDDSVCVTFDDNLKCQFDIARPVLARFRLTAFWFISTGVFRGHPQPVELHRAFRERHFASVNDFYGAFDLAWQASPHAAQVQQRLASFDAQSFLAEFPFYTPADRRYRFIRDEVLGNDATAQLIDQMMRDAHVDASALASDLWMSPEQVCSLHSDGHVIGLHTHTHPTRVAYLSPAEQEREYRDNYMQLMELLAEPIRVMSHPCNSYSETTLAVLRKLGIVLGFRSNMEPASHGPLEFPREDHANVLARMQKAATEERL